MKTLKQFYRELQAWIDDGCPEHEVFDVEYGLCWNLSAWSDNGTLLPKMCDSFVEAGLHEGTPFNPHGGYWHERNKGALYQNPARLAWIKEHAK